MPGGAPAQRADRPAGCLPFGAVMRRQANAKQPLDLGGQDKAAEDRGL
jgi:hypothetical protein